MRFFFCNRKNYTETISSGSKLSETDYKNLKKHCQEINPKNLILLHVFITTNTIFWVVLKQTVIAKTIFFFFFLYNSFALCDLLVE